MKPPNLATHQLQGRALAVAPLVRRIYERLHHSSCIGLDPLRWPRMYERPADQEVAAFLASALAYGNVRQINRSLEDLFRRMGASPSRFALNFVPGKSDRVLDGFYHRFNDSRDIAALIHAIGQMLREHGSIEGFWAAAQPAKPPLSITERAGNFIAAVRALDFDAYFPGGLSAAPSGVRNMALYLLPDAAGPSACKRLHMFLRWVVRPADGLDLGLWATEHPSDLEFPVDTHIHRIARFLGATRRNSADAKARTEITRFFRLITPEDPVRHDFSLCRLGILRECPTRARIEACMQCDLQPGCLQHRKLVRAGRRQSVMRELTA